MTVNELTTRGEVDAVFYFLVLKSGLTFPQSCFLDHHIIDVGIIFIIGGEVGVIITSSFVLQRTGVS